MIKHDLKSGYHQLAINPSHRIFNGIYYKGRKFALTRLPMGHALAPSVFQRVAEGFLRAVQRRSGVQFIAYLDDLLLWGTPEELQTAVKVVHELGATINPDKSVLIPTFDLTYLVFRINSSAYTIKLLLSTYDGLIHLRRFVKAGSKKDRERRHCYASWILFNLRLPSFLTKDILRGDPSWLKAALQDLSILEPKKLMDPPMKVDLFTDATPWRVAAVLPATQEHFAQAFEERTEQNRAELIAALQVLIWACSRVRDSTITPVQYGQRGNFLCPEVGFRQNFTAARY